MRNIARGALFITSGLFALGPSTAALSTPVEYHRTAIIGQVSAIGWTSSNWSGYGFAVSSPARSVAGRWKVPAVSATPGNTYSSSWVGIDGFVNSSLIQTGTEQDWVNGRASYAAWWEILPAPETIISLTVHPHDAMSAQIAQRGTTPIWDITITDVTTGQSFHTTQAYSGPGGSAEWIQEAPSVNGQLANLAHYGKTTFDKGGLNGAPVVLSSANAGAMIQHAKQVSTPSAPDTDHEGFSVKYGASSPSAPRS